MGQCVSDMVFDAGNRVIEASDQVVRAGGSPIRDRSVLCPGGQRQEAAEEKPEDRRRWSRENGGNDAEPARDCYGWPPGLISDDASFHNGARRSRNDFSE